MSEKAKKRVEKEGRGRYLSREITIVHRDNRNEEGKRIKGGHRGKGKG